MSLRRKLKLDSKSRLSCSILRNVDSSRLNTRENAHSKLISVNLRRCYPFRLHKIYSILP